MVWVSYFYKKDKKKTPYITKKWFPKSKINLSQNDNDTFLVLFILFLSVIYYKAVYGAEAL